MSIDYWKGWRKLNSKCGIEAGRLDLNEGYLILLSVFTDDATLIPWNRGTQDEVI